MLTVLLFTANRPEMLRTALRSISQQTALDQIVCITVSENGGNRASQSVCAEFPRLPIRYIYQSVPLTPLDHGRKVYAEELHSKYVAILHDDDWWTPEHVALALAALEQNDDASGYGSAHYVVSGESSMLNCSGNLFPWFAASYPTHSPYWKITRLNVLLGSLMGTLAHFSSLVLRTNCFRQSTYVFDLNNPFDNDRMLITALARTGPFLFDPSARVFVRNHGVQDCFEFKQQERINHMRGTTEWMIESSDKTKATLLQLFMKRVALCPPEALPTLNLLAGKPWCLPYLKEKENLCLIT